MTIKGCKTIAEYAIRRYLIDQGFQLAFFDLDMCENEGTVTDCNGDSLTFVYDSKERCVYVKDQK